MNVTVEYPEKAEELCQTDTTLYKTARVDTVDIGRYIRGRARVAYVGATYLNSFLHKFAQTDNEHYCFVRTTQGKSTCTIPYVYEFQADKTVMLRIAEKVRRAGL